METPKRITLSDALADLSRIVAEAAADPTLEHADASERRLLARLQHVFALHERAQRGDTAADRELELVVRMEVEAATTLPSCMSIEGAVPVVNGVYEVTVGRWGPSR